MKSGEAHVDHLTQKHSGNRRDLRGAAMQGGDGQGVLTVPSRPLNVPRPLVVLRRTSLKCVERDTHGDVQASGLMAGSAQAATEAIGDGEGDGEQAKAIGEVDGSTFSVEEEAQSPDQSQRREDFDARSPPARSRKSSARGSPLP